LPIVLRRDSQQHRLHARATGALTLDLVLNFLRRARTDPDDRRWPLLFDATGATSTFTDDDIDAAVALVRRAFATGGARAHAAIIADDDELFRALLLYEAKCADAGIRVIRVFRRLADADRWLETVSASSRIV
jgi:hypothetical protein